MQMRSAESLFIQLSKLKDGKGNLTPNQCQVYVTTHCCLQTDAYFIFEHTQR